MDCLIAVGWDFTHCVFDQDPSLHWTCVGEKDGYVYREIYNIFFHFPAVSCSSSQLEVLLLEVLSSNRDLSFLGTGLAALSCAGIVIFKCYVCPHCGCARDSLSHLSLFSHKCILLGQLTLSLPSLPLCPTSFPSSSFGVGLWKPPFLFFIIIPFSIQTDPNYRAFHLTALSPLLFAMLSIFMSPEFVLTAIQHRAGMSPTCGQ